MNLQGSIIERQNSIFQVYHKIEDRFSENSIIQALWSAMAQDLSLQINSLKAFPPSFWSQLKKDPDNQLEATVRESALQSFEQIEDLSLKRCFEIALQYEDATILKIYAPIIRSLRKNWTSAALDFYIMLKAHIARIVRVTESFAGDPVLIRHAHMLLQGFEKEVQEPPVNRKTLIKKAPVAHAEPKKKPEEKAAKTSRPAPLLAKHAKAHPGRAKTLVKKVELPRRRARR